MTDSAAMHLLAIALDWDDEILRIVLLHEMVEGDLSPTELVLNLLEFGAHTVVDRAVCAEVDL